jgi:hypothetical protein
MCGRTDKPIAALLTDLQARGLLDSTLVIWSSEFGRTPLGEGQNGRDHHPYAFSMWMAGAGIRGGQVLGSSDDFGLRPATNPYWAEHGVTFRDPDGFEVVLVPERWPTEPDRHVTG